MVEDSGARLTDTFSPSAVAGSRSCPTFMRNDSAEGAAAEGAAAEGAAVNRATEPGFPDPWQLGRMASRDSHATAMIRSAPRLVRGRRRGHCKS